MKITVVTAQVDEEMLEKIEKVRREYLVRPPRSWVVKTLIAKGLEAIKEKSEE